MLCQWHNGSDVVRSRNSGDTVMSTQDTGQSGEAARERVKKNTIRKTGCQNKLGLIFCCFLI